MNKCISLIVLIILAGCVSPMQNQKTTFTKDPVEIKQILTTRCMQSPFNNIENSLPFYLEKEKMFLTQVRYKCNEDKNNPVLITAVGIPCNGANGRVSWKGLYDNPKMVSFSFDVSCATHHGDEQQLQSRISKEYLNGQSIQLLAVNPIEIKHWETPTLNQSGHGDNIELRTNQGLKYFTNDMKKGASLPIILYGKENSWGEKKTLFKVEAELKMSGRSRFNLQVIKAQPLQNDDLQAISQRCKDQGSISLCILPEVEKTLAH